MGNNKALKRKVQITSVITLFVFLFDIYLIIYVPTDYILATAAFVTLVFAILTLSSWFKLKDIENQRREEQYTDIMKAEKGTYVITLDMMKQLDDKINFIGQKIMPLGKAGDANQRKIASMLDGIVEDQKKIAKITISRSKENADALMNSNDQLLAQMKEFRNTIDSIKEQVSRQTGSKESDGIGEIKDELFEKMQELTESIKKEVDEISENIELSNHAVENLVFKKLEQPVIEEPTISEEIAAEEPTISEEIAAEEPEMPEEIATEEPVVSEEIATEEPVVSEEIATEEPAVPEEIATEEPAVPEEIAAEEPAVPEEIATEELAVSEEMAAEEPAIPEAIEIEGDDIISELLMEKKPLDEAVISEEASIEEMSVEDIATLLASTQTETSSGDIEVPVEEILPEPLEEAVEALIEETVEVPPEETVPPAVEKAPMPDMSDPNKPMSPEDIAALIANTAAEDLPDETVKFEEEEAPPMPDMTDPNKMMSPDDIAALIANM